MSGSRTSRSTGVGEVLDRVVGVDVGHGRGWRCRSKGGRRVVLEWRKSIDRRRWRQLDQNHLPYIKNPVIIQVPYLQRISPSPYLSIKPSTLMIPCDFFHLSLYRWSLSQSLPIIPTRDHMRSYGASFLFISYLHDAPSLITPSIHSYHIVRSSLLHDSPIVTCLLDNLVRWLHDHEL